jgi:antitoxin YobK
MIDDAITTAFSIIENNSEDAFFAGEKPEELIRKAEQALGTSFPPSYCKFLRKYGCGNVAGLEFYGLTTDSFQTGSVPNGIWLTLDERKTSNLPSSLVIVADNGSGGWFALKTDEVDANGECPVVEKFPGTDEMPLVSNSFGDFLLSELESAIG